MPAPETSIPKSNPPSGNAGESTSTQQDASQAKQKKPETPSKPDSGPAPAKVSQGSDTSAIMLSYMELKEIADKIASGLSLPGDAKGLILTTERNVFRDIHFYRSATAVLGELLDRCDRLLGTRVTIQEEAVVPLGEQVKALTGILTAVSSLFALFKTQTSITQVAVTLDIEAIVAVVAGAISKSHDQVTVTYQPWITTDVGKLAAQLSQLKQKRIEVSRLLDGMADKDASPLKTKLEQILEVIDAVIAQFTLEDDTNLMRLLQAETLQHALSEAGVYILFLQLNFAGGDRIEIARSFFHRTDIYVSGGAVVTYMLTDEHGRILSSGNVQHHSGYIPYERMPTQHQRSDDGGS